MKYIHIIKANGTYKKQEVVNLPTLREMQMLVGGDILAIQVKYEGENRTMIVNEDGFLMGLPPNKKASLIVGSPIVGNVLILEGYRL